VFEFKAKDWGSLEDATVSANGFAEKYHQTISHLGCLSRNQLRDECKCRSVSIRGNREAFIARLLQTDLEVPRPPSSATRKRAPAGSAEQKTPSNMEPGVDSTLSIKVNKDLHAMEDITHVAFKDTLESLPKDTSRASYYVPRYIIEEFKSLAAEFNEGLEPPVEFMGWLLGTTFKNSKTKKDGMAVRSLYIPLQSSDPTRVWEVGNHGSELVKYMEQSELVVVGWIHTHPRMNAFLSSIDQHQQHCLQLLDSRATALVVDGDGETHAFRLTDLGMRCCASCATPAAWAHEHEPDMKL